MSPRLFCRGAFSIVKYTFVLYEKACQALIEQAAIRWRHTEGDYRDDITAIIIRLSPFDLIGRDNRRAERRSRMDFNASEDVDKFTEKDMEDLRGSMGLAASAS